MTPTMTPAQCANSPTWTTYTRAAARYGVSTRSLRTKVREGHIRALKFEHARPSVYLNTEDLESMYRLVEPAKKEAA